MNAYVYAARRTPIATADPSTGYYRHTRADDLAAHLVRALPDKRALASDVVLGCVKQQAEQGFNLARTVALLAGLPERVPGVTVNRACGSGLEALNYAARLVHLDGGLVVAGGVEHMQHIPMDPVGVTNPRLHYAHSPAMHNMGLLAEHLARRFGVSRDEQDAFAFASQHKAQNASDAGLFVREIAPTPAHDADGWPVTVCADQTIRRNSSRERLAQLEPAFLPGGTVTAGNSCPLSVGAALLLVGSERADMRPLARVVSSAVVGVEPELMGLGPVSAIRLAVERAGLQLSDVDLYEINEAFAVQALACIRELALDPARVNVLGGALALGHPLGATGARLAVTLIHALHQRGERFGVVGLCVGGGQGIATVFERVG